MVRETQKVSGKYLCWKCTQRYLGQAQLAISLFPPEQVVEMWAPITTKGKAWAIQTPVASSVFTNRASLFLFLNLQCATWAQQWCQAIEWTCWQYRSHRKIWSKFTWFHQGSRWTEWIIWLLSSFLLFGAVMLFWVKRKGLKIKPTFL